MARNIQERNLIESTGTSTIEQSGLVDGSNSNNQYGLEGKQIGSNALSSTESNLVSDVDKGKVLGRIGSFLSNFGSFLKGDKGNAENLGGGLSNTQSSESSDPVKLAQDRAMLAFLNNPGNFLGNSDSFGVPVSSFLSEGDNWLNKSVSTNNAANGGTTSEADFLNNPGVMLGSDSGLARFSKLELGVGGTSTEAAKIEQPNKELPAQQNSELGNEANQLASNLTTDNQPIKTAREVVPTIAESEAVVAAEGEASPLLGNTELPEDKISPSGSFGSDSNPALVDPKTGEIIAEPDLNTMGKMGLLGKPGSDSSPESIAIPIPEMVREAPVTALPEPDQASQPLVGVIDTGFNVAEAKISRGNISLGWDRVGKDGDPLLKAGEGNEHGTHILSTIAAQQDQTSGLGGVNSKAPLWLGRAVGSGEWSESLVEFVDAAKAAGQKNAIANLSFDLTQRNIDGSVTTRTELTAQETAALAYAQENKVLVVVAAGNQNGEMSGLGKASLQFDNVISVGSEAGGKRAEYASHGEGLDVVADGGTPKDPMLSRMGDGAGAMAGTSISAAKVTGLLSELWAANPELNYQQVADILNQSATDQDMPGWDMQTGHGKVDRDAAISLARNTTAAELKPPESNGVVPTSFEPQSMTERGVMPGERAAFDFFGGLSSISFEPISSMADFTSFTPGPDIGLSAGGSDVFSGLATGGGGGVDPAAAIGQALPDGAGGGSATGTNTDTSVIATGGNQALPDNPSGDQGNQALPDGGGATGGGGDQTTLPDADSLSDNRSNGSDSSSETIFNASGDDLINNPATQVTIAEPQTNPAGPQTNPAVTPTPSPSPSEARPGDTITDYSIEPEVSPQQPDADQVTTNIDPFSDTGNNFDPDSTTALADTTTTTNSFFDNSAGDSTDNGVITGDSSTDTFIADPATDFLNDSPTNIADSTTTNNFFDNFGDSTDNGAIAFSPTDIGLNNTTGELGDQFGGYTNGSGSAISANNTLTDNNPVNWFDPIGGNGNPDNLAIAFTPTDIGLNNTTGELGNQFGGYTNGNGSAMIANNPYDIANGKPLDSSDLLFNEIGNGSPLTYKFADENPTLVAQVFGNNTKTTILNGGQPANTDRGGTFNRYNGGFSGVTPSTPMSNPASIRIDKNFATSPTYSVGEAFGKAVGDLLVLPSNSTSVFANPPSISASSILPKSTFNPLNSEQFVKDLQGRLGFTGKDVDGILGPKTINAATNAGLGYLVNNPAPAIAGITSFFGGGTPNPNANTFDLLKPLKDITTTASDVGTGFGYQTLVNNGSLAHPITDQFDPGAPKMREEIAKDASFAFRGGQVIADILGLIQSVEEMGGGAAMTVGGVTTTVGSGGTASLVGIPVTAAGVATTIHGASVGKSSLDDLIKQGQVLFSRDPEPANQNNTPLQPNSQGTGKNPNEQSGNPLVGSNRQLIEGLTEQGIKHTPENIVGIGETPTGKTVFLETGNSQAGLEHIVERHGADFERRGIPKEQIPDAVITAVTKGTVVGTQGSRPIYEVNINGQTQRIAVTVGKNGFIVGANPAK
jgi:lipoprotein-anchoring transpeptidase ErfK/SrfK